MDAHPESGDPASEFRDWQRWPSEPGIITDIDRWCQTLRDLETGDSASEAQGRIRALEELTSAAAAAQAREAVAFHEHRKREDAANNVPKREHGIYAGSEIALAKRVSPATGRKFLSSSKAVVNDLPHTYEALADGSISEFKAHIVADETAGLSAEERRAVDDEIKDRVLQAGNRRLRREVRALTAEISSESAYERAEAAGGARCVTMSVLDNGMGRVSATMPLQQAISAYESLRAAADEAKINHQTFGRNRDQTMVDILVERLTGQSAAAAVPTEVHLVMEAESLFSDGRTPAWLPGYGPIPAKTARDFLAANEARSFIRRMFTSPDTKQLVGMDSRRRTFGGLLRRMVVFRDDLCRTPWCDAPIKHADHATPVAEGGETEWSNASGLCASCNYTKEHAGWKHQATAENLTVSTPTGEEYAAATPPFVTKSSHSPPGEEQEPGENGRPTTSRSEEPDSESDQEVANFPGVSVVEELFEELVLRDTG